MEQDLIKEPTTSPKKTPVNVTPKLSQAGASSSASKVVVFTPEQLQKLDFAKQLQDVINKQVNPLYITENKRPYKKRHPKLVKNKNTKPNKISKEQSPESITKSLKQKFSQVVNLDKNFLLDPVNSESSVAENIQSGKSDVKNEDVVKYKPLNVKKGQVVQETVKLKTQILNKNEEDNSDAKDDNDKSSKTSDDIIVEEQVNIKEKVIRDLFKVKIVKEVQQLNEEGVIPEVANSNESRSSLNDSEINKKVLTTNDYVTEEKELIQNKKNIISDETKSSEAVQVNKQLNEENVSFELLKPHETKEQSVTVGETMEEIAEEVKQINADQKQRIQETKIDATKEESMKEENKIVFINQNIQIEEPVPEVVHLKPQSRHHAGISNQKSDGGKQDTVEEVQKLNLKNSDSPITSKKTSQSVIEKEVCTSPEIPLRRRSSVKLDYAERNENNTEVKKLSETEKEVAQNTTEENEKESFVSEVVQAKSLLKRRNSRKKTEEKDEEEEVADKNQRKEDELVPEVAQAKPLSTRKQSVRKNKERARGEAEEQKNEEFGILNVGQLKSPLQRRLSVRIDYAKNNGNNQEVKKLHETKKQEEAPVSEIINSIPLLTRRQSVNKGETDEEFSVSNFGELKSPSKRRLSLRIDYAKSNENIEEVKKSNKKEKQSVRKTETEEDKMEEHQKPSAKRRLSVRIDYTKDKKLTEEEEKESVAVEKKEELVQSKALLTRRPSLRKDKAKEQKIERTQYLNEDAEQLKSPLKRRLSLRIDYVKNNENIQEVKTLTEEKKEVAQNEKRNKKAVPIIPEVAQSNPLLTRRKSVRKSEENSDKQKDEVDRRRPSITNENAKSPLRKKQGTRTDKCEGDEVGIKAAQKEIVQLKSRRQSGSVSETERTTTKKNNVGEVFLVNQNGRSKEDDKEKQSHENVKDVAQPEITQLKRKRNDIKPENKEIFNHNSSETEKDVIKEGEQLEEHETSQLEPQQRRDSESIVDPNRTDAGEESNKIKLRTYQNRSKKDLKNNKTKEQDQKPNQKDILKSLELIPSQQAETLESCKINENVTDHPKHEEEIADRCSVEEKQKVIQLEETEKKKCIQIVANEVVFFSPSDIQNMTKNSKCKPVVLAADPALVILQKSVNLQEVIIRENKPENEEAELILKEETAQPRCYIRKNKKNVDQNLFAQSNKKSEKDSTDSTREDGDEVKVEEEKREFVNLETTLFKNVDEPSETPEIAESRSKSHKKTETLNKTDLPEQIDVIQMKSGLKRKLAKKNSDELTKLAENAEILQTSPRKSGRSRKSTINSKIKVVETVESKVNLPVASDAPQGDSLTSETSKLVLKNIKALQEFPKKKGRPRKSTLISKTELVETVESEANLSANTEALQKSSMGLEAPELVLKKTEISPEPPKKKGRPRKSSPNNSMSSEAYQLVLKKTEILQEPRKKRGRPSKSALLCNTEVIETVQLEANLPINADSLEDDSGSFGTSKLIKESSTNAGRSRKSTPSCKTEVVEIIKSKDNLLVETDPLEGHSTTRLVEDTEILNKTPKKKGRPRKSTTISKTDVVETSEFQPNLSLKSIETTPQTPTSSGRSKRKRKVVDYSKLSRANESEVENDEDFVLKKPKKRKKLDQDIFEIDVGITPNPQTEEIDCSVSEVNKRNKKGQSKNAKLFYSLVNDAKLNDISTLNEETISSDKTDVGVKIKQDKNKSNTNVVTCDVCKLEMEKKEWPNHKLKKHNNLAWKVGEKPLDLNDSKFVLGVLNEMYINKKNHYYCDKCENVSRSVQGYLSHRSRCQKSTQDLIALQVTCEHCERVMLPVSMYTHLKFCRGLKPNDEGLEETKVQEDSPLPRKRKAAEKASQFITALNEEDDQPKERNFKYSKKWIENYNFDVVPWAKKLILEQCRENGSAKCCFKGCEYQNSDWSEIFSHFKECTKKLEGFSCKLCLSTFETKPGVLEHLKENHSDEFKTDLSFDDDESNDSYDEENEEENLKKRKDNKSSTNISLFKQTFLLKFSKDLCPISVSKPIVFPSAWKWTFDFCRENFSEPNLFSDWRNASLQNLDSSKIGTYLPKQKYSVCTSVIKCQKYINPLASDYDWKRFMLFETSKSDCGVFSIFCGGSISAMAWLPTPYEIQICEQILAVAVQPDLEPVYKVNQFYSDPGIIQFWNCGSFETAPKLQFCIAHDYNPIWCLEWCPSGCYDVEAKENESKRLGILAVGSGNSNVYLYSVSEPQATSGKIIKMKPIKQLSLIINTKQCSATLKPHVSKICWTKAAGHQHIAVGYTNGVVALYNLNNLSDLLKYKADDELEAQQPYLTINAHVHSVTALTLSHINGGCRWLMTASADRTIKYWDLREPTTPITSSSKFVVTDGVWLTHWLCSIVCFDDSCNTGITQTSLHQVRNFKSDTCNIMHSNSAIQCINANDWINGIIQGNAAGEIQAFFPHQLLHGMDNNSKHFKKKKVFLSYCRVVEKNISIEERLARENEKLKLMVTKPIEVVDMSKITSNPNRYKPEPATYKGAENKYGVVFCDYQLNKVEQIAANFTDYTNAHKEKYYPTRPNLYPMQCITKVQFNPNRSSYNYFAAGYQIGFVRIYPMKFITTK